KNITNKYLGAEKKVTLSHLSPECQSLLLKANPEWADHIQTSIDDPRYYVVTDMMDAELTAKEEVEMERKIAMKMKVAST
ncbi:MAG: hypothetical protein AAF599_19100, partial [Bacteroidota bacterium]